ncbi:growth factor receptor-bound protein 10 [Salvelinus sp. IW2-2015]|uniref:growth factor receptor-bound protein 10 n=1 Tax=Salvelinus sp. IW2-2015 TaxID=2691554 RepID=UPI0038D4A686
MNVKAREGTEFEELLDIGTAITNLDLDEDLYFNESELLDIGRNWNTLSYTLIHSIPNMLNGCLLSIKLKALGLNAALCNWVLDFPTGRPREVKAGNNISTSLILNTGAPQMRVLSPLLYSLFTHDCVVMQSSNSIITFTDDTTIIKVYSEDGVGKVVEVPADMRARDVCQFLVYKSHCLDDNSWSLVEHHPLLGLERCLEDHELVVQVQASMTSDSKFLFRKNYDKYEFFRNPLPSKVRSECKELRMLCAEDEQSRTCWMTAFRLLKYGILLDQNYKSPQQRKSPVSHFSTPVRSVSENSLVAMDFSGRTGRVIENPLEAVSAAVEEGQKWRKRGQRMKALGSPSPLQPSSLSSVIHRTQLWFHGRIRREESHKMIMQQGQVDGLFLLRDCQSNTKAFVLTLCHHQKIRHFQILPCEEEGQMSFSLDDGTTKFTDLIHLVEFYQLNRGVLPCKLKHPCTAVAL